MERLVSGLKNLGVLALLCDGVVLLLSSSRDLQPSQEKFTGEL